LTLLSQQAPPVAPAPPTEVRGAPLEIPKAKDGATTVLGAEESASAARMQAEQASAAPATAAPAAADPHREALVDLHRKLFPPPLTEEELDAWCAAVGLGPEALEHARAVLQSYHSRLRGPSTPRATGDSLGLVAASYRWSEEGDRLVPLWTPVHVAMVVRRREHLEALRQAEQSLVAAVLPLVIAERRDEAKRLLFQRRVRLETSGAGDALAEFDLIGHIRELELSSADATSIDQVLDVFIRDMEPLLRHRREAGLQLDLEQAQLELGLGPFWELTVDSEERAALAAELDALRSGRDELDAPVRAAIRSATQALIERLPPELAIAFADRVMTHLPAPTADAERSLARLLSTSVELPLLDESHRQGRLAFHAAVRRKLLPLGLEAAELTARRRGLPETRSGDEIVDRAAAISRVELYLRALEVARLRRAASLEAVNGLRSLLTVREESLLRDVEQLRDELAMQSGAEAWLARRARDRLSALQTRQAEAMEALEHAALEAHSQPSDSSAQPPPAEDPATGGTSKGETGGGA